jgi:hypothetical protein
VGLSRVSLQTTVAFLNDARAYHQEKRSAPIIVSVCCGLWRFHDHCRQQWPSPVVFGASGLISEPPKPRN